MDERSEKFDCTLYVMIPRGHGEAFADRVESWCRPRGGTVVCWHPGHCAPRLPGVSRGVLIGAVATDSPDQRAESEGLLSADCHTVVCSTKERLEERLDAAFEVVKRLRRLERQLSEAGLLGVSKAMVRVRERLALAIGSTMLPVLLVGETGTGKYVAAKALHEAESRDRGRPFQSANCAGLTESLSGSELFGHVKGAFTGAETARAGAFASARGGSLLLDEIGELTQELQAALLTTLQDRRFRPVGSDIDCPVECRIIAATNRDLPAMIRDGSFRSDLFHRIDGLRVELPPLRDRREDLPQLFSFLVAKHAGREVHVRGEAVELIQELPLPGNVRELEMIARRTVLQAGSVDEVSVAHVLWATSTATTTNHLPSTRDPIVDQVLSGRPLEDIARASKQRAIEIALEQVRRRVGEVRRRDLIRAVATHLRVSERTVYQHLSGGTGQNEL